ncbi:glycosyltransferase [Candidatus Saccharibacteria bacterium RIFCSPHIGHO2_01_FULL_46_30]|nr:MAG: glycosyltransferase [Candidatus Saccharibacteria bacterium RIFCSPHIGHO2_01_FULL_46_30]
MKKVYKLYTYTKNEGVAKTAKRTVKYVIKHTTMVKQPIEILTAIDDVIKADYIHHPYVAPAMKNKKKLKIGWVLSPLSNGAGGQNTIARFARYLSEAGHDVTFYIYENSQAQSLSEAREIMQKSFKLNIPVKKLKNYEESDALIATGWETTYPTFNTETDAHKFYFVQDFEPYFYGVGSQYVLAENTYKMNFYGITAGPWLTKKVSEYGMRSDYFEFGADLDIYRPKQKVQKKKKICFYARPVTERRAFEVGVMALDLFKQKHPEYEIEFMGWDVSNFKLPFKFENRGIITHAELAELYHESVACLVLSLTNVSLLPLELIAAGCVPVMNEGENNRMVLHGKDQYVDYAPTNPIELAEALCKAVERENIDEYAEMAANSVNSLSWDNSYKKVEEIITREVTGS